MVRRVWPCTSPRTYSAPDGIRSLARLYDPCLIDADWLHLIPATLLWHRQRKPSEWVESADHVISRPQVLHYILLRSSPVSFRNWIAMDCFQKRYMRKNLFGPPSSLSIRRPKENLGTYSHLRNRSSYSELTWRSCSTIIFVKEVTLYTPRGKWTANSWKTQRVVLWVQNAKCIVGFSLGTWRVAGRE